MTTAPHTYKQLIVEGIQDLPVDLLAEVADFVYFLRKRATDPETFAVEQYALLLNQDLRAFSAAETVHLEAEIEGYESRYPHE